MQGFEDVFCHDVVENKFATVRARAIPRKVDRQGKVVEVFAAECHPIHVFVWEVFEYKEEDFGWEVLENLDWRRRNSSILAVRGKRAVPWTTTGTVVGRGSSGHHRLHGRRTGNVS
jgi:hypothetical protein